MSDPTILTERLRGRTLRDLAEANEMTAESVRLVVVRESRKHIDGIVLQLLVNTKTDDVLAFAIPDHGGEDFDVGMAFVLRGLLFCACGSPMYTSQKGPRAYVCRDVIQCTGV